MASADYYLKIDSIPGESKDKGHAGSIEVLSWSWGQSQQISDGGSSGGAPDKASMSPFEFVKRIDKTSPLLMSYAGTGKHFDKVQLTVRSRGNSKRGEKSAEYIKLTFTDCLVSSIQGHTADPRLPLERVSFNFYKMTLSAQQFSSKGLIGSPVVGEFDEQNSGTP